MNLPDWSYSKYGARRPDEPLVAYAGRTREAYGAEAKRRRENRARQKAEIAEKASRNLTDNKDNPGYDRELAVASAISTKLLGGRVVKAIKTELTTTYPRRFDRPKGKAPGYDQVHRRLSDLEIFRQMPPLAISKANVFGRIRVAARLTAPGRHQRHDGLWSYQHGPQKNVPSSMSKMAERAY